MTNEQTNNPLLQRLKVPGETFRLPSQGLFYHNGELSDDVTNGEVHVFPMTTIEEIMFKSPDMLFSGKALDEVFGRCIPQVKHPRQLLSKDVDYLMTCLRIATYSQTMDVVYTHVCEGAKEHNYKIDLRSLIKQARAVDPTTMDTTYTLTMENGQVVKLRPTLFSTMLELSQSVEFSKTEPTFDDIKRSIVSVIVGVIDNIDGITDKQQIGEWVCTASAGYINKISQAIEKTSDWGVDFSVDDECQDCKQPIKLTIGTNPITFFS